MTCRNRPLALLAACGLAVSLTACGDGPSNETDPAMMSDGNMTEVTGEGTGVPTSTPAPGSMQPADPGMDQGAAGGASMADGATGGAGDTPGSSENGDPAVGTQSN